ncbi:MAG: hypothetical protein IH589_06835 [Anaerolineales bacterium]|nr:hypothetical protein [Anaerolineales bacterium]
MIRNWIIWILAAGWTLCVAACTSSQSTDSASPSPQPASSTESSSSPSALLTPTLLPEEPPPARVESEFTTDFSKHSVPYSEILSGGPPPNGTTRTSHRSFLRMNFSMMWTRMVKETCNHIYRNRVIAGYKSGIRV